MQTDVQELAAAGFVVGMPNMGGVKSKSISQLKEERMQLLREYQRVLDEVSRLRNLMRLVDYIVSGCRIP